MITSFHLKNFRCFQDFNITPLQRINLITGMNNVGKTALLEGLFLFAGATNPKLAISINAFRGIDTFELKDDLESETPWSSLFYNFDENSEISLSGDIGPIKQRKLIIRVTRKESELVTKKTYQEEKNGFILTESTGKMLEFEYHSEAGKVVKSKMVIESRSMKMERPQVSIPYNAIFLASSSRIDPAENAARFSKVEINLQQEILIKILNIIEPKLRRLTVAVTAGVPMIYGDIGLNRLLPLAIMGEGLMRVCSIVLAMANTSNGIIFIDEIENGVHHSIMEKLWIGIAEAARQLNTQIFATTHSRECIMAAHFAFRQSFLDDFLLHRLDKRNGKIDVKTYDKETLKAAIDSELEVR